MGGFARRWGPALAVMAAIFAFSSRPAAELPDLGAWDLVGKKGGHLLGYALLGAAYLRGLAWRRAPSLALGAAAVAAAVLYAATDEFHQGFVPGRTPSGLDVLVDAAGAAAGVVAATLRRRARPGPPTPAADR